MSAAHAAAPIYALPSPERWLSLQEVLAVTGWTDRWLRKQVSLGIVVSRAAEGVLPNGRPQREYLAASLPPEARARLAGTAATVTEERRAFPLLSAPLFSSQKLEEPVRIVLGDAAAQKQAEDRLAILQPILDFQSDPARYVSLRLTDGRPVTSMSRMLLYQAETSGTAQRTLKYWLKSYRDGGFPGLADRQRKDKGDSRWFARNNKAALFAANLFLNHQQNYRACHEAILQDAELLGIAANDLPSYETVRSWLASAPPYLKAYAREGRQSYQTRMSPHIRRHFRDVAPNQIWVSDHMIHDVEVANDCFPELEWGAPMRLRFTCLFDFHSRYIVGASWCREGSSGSIATAIRRAVLQHGPCEHFYCDNGKDYRKVAKGAVRGSMTAEQAAQFRRDQETAALEERGIMARLGMKVTHCIVRHPQSKHIERFFGTLHTRFDRLWHTYTGRAPHLRPDATAAAMEYHRKLMRHDRVEESLHPPASYFIHLCMWWIEEYHNRVHGGEGMDGRTPAEAFFGDNQVRRQAPDPRDLAMLLAEHKICQVNKSSIRLHKRRYVHCDATSLAVLHERNEQKVTVAYDPLDPQYIAVLDEGGHYLCHAKSEEMLNFDPADQETQRKIGESMAERRHLEKQTRNLIDGIARGARSHGARSPVEMLAERAQLPQLIDGALTHKPKRIRPDDQAVAPPSAADIAADFLEAMK